MPRARRIATATTAGLLASGLGVAVWFSGPAQQAKVNALATLVLVSVTTWYVRLTRDLVAAQREATDQARGSDKRRADAETALVERQALVALWRLGVTDMLSSGYERKQLALLVEPTAWENASKAIKAAGRYQDNLATRCDGIVLLIPDLPKDMRDECWATATKLMRAARILQELSVYEVELELASREGGSEPNVGMLKARWELEVSDSGSDVSWASLTSGEFLVEAEEAADNLEAAALRRAERAT